MIIQGRLSLPTGFVGKRRHGLKFAGSVAAVCLSIMGAASNCESIRQSSLSVSVEPSSCIEGESGGCYRAVDLRIDGSGLPADTPVRIYLPEVAGDGQPGEIPIISDRTTSLGTISTRSIVDRCQIVAAADLVNPARVFAIDDASGSRLAFTFVDARSFVCQPPFARLSGTQPCGSGLCPSLSTDSPTSIGVHWDRREVRADKYRISYGPMDGTSAPTTTRDFGSDVGDVAINNLVPRITYVFRVQSCSSPFIGSDTCYEWVEVGYAAAG